EFIFLERFKALEFVLVENDDQPHPDERAAQDVDRGKLKRGVAGNDAEHQQHHPQNDLEQKADGGHSGGSLVGVVVDSHLMLLAKTKSAASGYAMPLKRYAAWPRLGRNAWAGRLTMI